MKKTFQIIGLIAIIILSIIISNQTTIVVKNIDTLILEITQQEKKYNETPQNAKIQNNTIIPGKYGRKINIEKTYQEMKKIGKFNEKYIIYEEIKPEISIEQNKNKYIISGNSQKNEISIIAELNDTKNIEKILKILDENQIKITFYIENQYLTREIIKKIEKSKHTIETNNPTNFCIVTETNEQKLNDCARQKKYTILPNIIIKESLLKETKKQIKPGSIIKTTLNNNTIKDLELTIKYIKSKGYIIKNIEEHISEKNNN